MSCGIAPGWPGGWSQRGDLPATVHACFAQTTAWNGRQRACLRYLRVVAQRLHRSHALRSVMSGWWGRPGRGEPARRPRRNPSHTINVARSALLNAREPASPSTWKSCTVLCPSTIASRAGTIGEAAEKISPPVCADEALSQQKGPVIITNMRFAWMPSRFFFFFLFIDELGLHALVCGRSG